MVPEGELNPQGTKYRRILSTRAGSDLFRKFSTLFDSSTGYKPIISISSDGKCSVLSIELLQFYYSGTMEITIGRKPNEEVENGSLQPV